MRLNHDSYSQYIQNLSREIDGENLYSPVLLNNETLLFPFVNKTSDVLVVSLNNKCPLLYKIRNEQFFTSFENNFIKDFRKNYGRGIIKNLQISESDYIVQFDLIFEVKTIKVILELISNSPNLIILENSIIQKAYFKYENRTSNFGEKYLAPVAPVSLDGEQLISNEFLSQHFKNEIQLRSKEKYSEFSKFLDSKIKSINKKIIAIHDDAKKADEMLSFKDIADSIFTKGFDLKSRQNHIEIDGKIINLDPSKTLLENCNNFYKKTKKARETLNRNKTNLENAEKELQNFVKLRGDFLSQDERGRDLIISAYKPNKKHETKKTEMNRPWKYNLNGTYIYFGRNASQNDYLSFIMKFDREFTWLHIKDKSGAHLVIANKKPTENELLFACEFALICSHCKTGEIVYTKKKNVRKGHVLGEAILKNYSTIKLNRIREETIKAFENIKRCD